MTPDDRRPICPPDKHEHVCHCGEDMDDHPTESYWVAPHAPVSMGCGVCCRTTAELQAQADR